MDEKISLRAARVNAGMSQAFAAETIGVSERTLSKWEHGKTHPNGVQLVRISQLYGISLDRIRLT